MKQFFMGVFGCITTLALIFTGVVVYSGIRSHREIDVPNVLSSETPAIESASSPAAVALDTVAVSYPASSPSVSPVQEYTTPTYTEPAAEENIIVTPAASTPVMDPTEEYVRSVLESSGILNYDLEISGYQYYFYVWDDNVTNELESGNYTYDSFEVLKSGFQDFTYGLREYLYSVNGFGIAIIELVDGPQRNTTYLIACDGQIDYDFTTDRTKVEPYDGDALRSYAEYSNLKAQTVFGDKYRYDVVGDTLIMTTHDDTLDAIYDGRTPITMHQWLECKPGFVYAARSIYSEMRSSGINGHFCANFVYGPSPDIVIMSIYDDGYVTIDEIGNRF